MRTIAKMILLLTLGLATPAAAADWITENNYMWLDRDSISRAGADVYVMVAHTAGRYPDESAAVLRFKINCERFQILNPDRAEPDEVSPDNFFIRHACQ